MFFSAKLLPYRQKQGRAEDGRGFIAIHNLYVERLTFCCEYNNNGNKDTKVKSPNATSQKENYCRE